MHLWIILNCHCNKLAKKQRRQQNDGHKNNCCFLKNKSQPRVTKFVHEFLNSFWINRQMHIVRQHFVCTQTFLYFSYSLCSVCGKKKSSFHKCSIAFRDANILPKTIAIVNIKLLYFSIIALSLSLVGYWISIVAGCRCVRKIFHRDIHALCIL